MSWQEELRKLDEELASGRLSADDYRVRRDQVLSSAVGQSDGPPAQPGQPQDADSTQLIPPVGQSPVSQSSGSQSSATPAQQPSAPAAGDDRTQVVAPWQGQQQPTDPNRTQYVQPQYPASPPGGFPQAGPMSPAGGFPQVPPGSPAGGFPQPGWNAPAADQAPPWGGGDLPPLTPSGGAGWVQQGPESFDDKAGKSTGKKIAVIVVTVVVLVGIALGAFLMWGKSTQSSAGSNDPGAQPSQPTSSKAPDPLAVATIPGTAESHDNVTTFDAVSQLNYLNSSELSTYSSAGAAAAKYVVHHLADGNTVVLLLTQVNSPVAAQNAASQLLSIQLHNGAKTFSGVPSAVYASDIEAKDGNPAEVRGHYAHSNVIVRIEVHGSSLQSVESDFTNVLNSQLKVLPADG
ncbi:MAG TPA: hypothetical protein VFG87_07230 [Amycolatopsis sp.]|nr:hypothetical protein [Amycolatopsis sp.]